MKINEPYTERNQLYSFGPYNIILYECWYSFIMVICLSLLLLSNEWRSENLAYSNLFIHYNEILDKDIFSSIYFYPYKGWKIKYLNKYSNKIIFRFGENKIGKIRMIEDPYIPFFTRALLCLINASALVQCSWLNSNFRLLYEKATHRNLYLIPISYLRIQYNYAFGQVDHICVHNLI